MVVTKHHILLLLCIIFLFALSLRSSIISSITFAYAEHYDNYSYDIDLAAAADEIEKLYQKNVLQRKTIESSASLSSGLLGAGQGGEGGVGGEGGTNKSCQSAFNCQLSDESLLSSSRNGRLGRRAFGSTSPQSSSLTPGANKKGDPTKCVQQVTYVNPPSISAEDLLALDLWGVDEKIIDKALTDAQSIQNGSIDALRNYQDTLRDAMMDGFAKTNQLSKANNLLETTMQNQAIATNAGGAMVDSLNAATQPVIDKVNELARNVDQMRGIVDRTRARCNSVRFAFGKGCKI